VAIKDKHVRPLWCGLFSNYFEQFCFYKTCIAIKHIDAAEVSTCYSANARPTCFYTGGSLLNKTEARKFCASKNSRLPIITDENINNAFLQFIVNDANTTIENRPVWLDAYARHVDSSTRWHWINGQPSSKWLYTINFSEWSGDSWFWTAVNLWSIFVVYSVIVIEWCAVDHWANYGHSAKREQKLDFLHRTKLFHTSCKQ